VSESIYVEVGDIVTIDKGNRTLGEACVSDIKVMGDPGSRNIVMAVTLRVSQEYIEETIQEAIGVTR
jgi:hypothetical protein